MVRAKIVAARIRGRRPYTEKTRSDMPRPDWSTHSEAGSDVRLGRKRKEQLERAGSYVRRRSARWLCGSHPNSRRGAVRPCVVDRTRGCGRKALTRERRTYRSALSLTAISSLDLTAHRVLLSSTQALTSCCKAAAEPESTRVSHLNRCDSRPNPDRCADRDGPHLRPRSRTGIAASQQTRSAWSSAA
jgi:hypothetical protein